MEPRNSGNHRSKSRNCEIVHDAGHRGTAGPHWQQRGTAARRHCGPTAGRTPRHRWWITGNCTAVLQPQDGIPVRGTEAQGHYGITAMWLLGGTAANVPWNRHDGVDMITDSELQTHRT